ncbi:DUF72 domain-containing protein [Thermodesulfobacteriota bacterium]
MNDTRLSDIAGFRFRDLHPRLFIGTASDRYAGWIGQIYSEKTYREKISTRPKRIKGNAFTEEILPVESVTEYFQHFSILELDFTFYGFLFDDQSQPMRNYHILSNYRKFLAEKSRLILKVPQRICARRLWRGGKFIENPDYLDPKKFTDRFYQPAVALAGQYIDGFLFEQEYLTKKDRPAADKFAEDLETFCSLIPRDDRYHFEVRTPSLLTDAYFDVLDKYGCGQALSHWTWLPSLRKQFQISRERFLNAGRQMVIRLMTPLKMRYEDTYQKAFPFDKMVDNMMSPQMVEETVDLILTAISTGVRSNVVINNRAGGNAPSIAQMISERFSNL